MKRFRKYTAGLLLLVLVLGVSACGNSDNNGGTNKPNTENNGTTNNGATTDGTVKNEENLSECKTEINLTCKEKLQKWRLL